MNIIAAVVGWVLLLHWLADFVCQSHWMASNKSKSNKALGLHVAVYTIVMTLGLAPVFALPSIGVRAAALFAAITFVTHFATDYVTSRITSRLWAKQDWHNFFVVVGFDQLLHYVTLLGTLAWALR